MTRNLKSRHIAFDRRRIVLLAFVAAAALAGAPAAAQPADLTSAASACKAPASWLSLQDDGRVMLRTDAGAAYSQVMCVLGQLQDRGIYKVGLIASPASPLPAKVTIATK
ncbi:hypothetical protein DDF62_04755 [Caulobacter radicis]|nr:hypothetical protein DDF62_04755 [Caulobacter radicis]